MGLAKCTSSSKRKYVRRSQTERKKAQKVAKRALELEKEHSMNSKILSSVKRQKIDVDSGTTEQPKEAESGYRFAVFRGKTCELSVTKELSVIGRGTKSNTVDIDLSKETGPDVSIGKVSRRQAELRLDLETTYKTTTSIATGYESETSQLPPTYSYSKSPVMEPRFTLKNVGKRKILVNNHSVGATEQVEVTHGSMIVLPGDFKFLFLVNMDELQMWAKQKAEQQRQQEQQKQQQQQQEQEKQQQQEQQRQQEKQQSSQEGQQETQEPEPMNIEPQSTVETPTMDSTDPPQTETS